MTKILPGTEAHWSHKPVGILKWQELNGNFDELLERESGLAGEGEIPEGCSLGSWGTHFHGFYH